MRIVMVGFESKYRMLRSLAVFLLALGCRGAIVEENGDANRLLRARPNAFSIVQKWMREYQEMEKEANEIHIMDPKNHVLFGRSVPIVTTPTDISTFIVGGEPTEEAASWMVMLLHWVPDSGQWQFAGCSGTLIASKYVLTAAHCVSDRLLTPLSWNAVYVQAFAPFERGNGGLDAHFSLVESFDVHAEFTSTRFDKDVALIKLATPVDTATFQAVQLAENDNIIQNDDVVTIYGFGWTDEEADDHSDVLRAVDVPFVSSETCRQYHGYQITDDMVCAGLQQGGKDACNGDSGGPLVRHLSGLVYQVGIVSWGEGCARANSPGVYSSVSYYYRWISARVCTDAEMQVELVDSLCRIETSTPTEFPTIFPTTTPTSIPPPTVRPTDATTELLTIPPSSQESPLPFKPPTHSPVSTRPTKQPSSSPTRAPFSRPTRSPIRSPSQRPTPSPFARPTEIPTTSPSTSEPTDFVCLSAEAPCHPSTGLPCCNGSCVEWGDGDDRTFYTCFVHGKKGKSKKKMSKKGEKRGRT